MNAYWVLACLFTLMALAAGFVTLVIHEQMKQDEERKKIGRKK